MITDNGYQNLFRYIYNFYNEKVYNISNFSFNNIYICSNIEEGMLRLGLNKYYIDEYRNISGAVILPIDMIKEMILLVKVSNKYNFQDVVSLVHELTHVYDIICYSRFYTNGIIQNFRNRPFYDVYQYYSEFHAHYCDELYSNIFQDTFTGSKGLKKAIENQNQCLENYIKIKREQLLSHEFTVYDLFTVLGKIYLLDKFNNIQNIENSCIYDYITLLYKTNKKEAAIEIYKICFACMNDNTLIFKKLEQLDTILNSISIYS